MNRGVVYDTCNVNGFGGEDDNEARWQFSHLLLFRSSCSLSSMVALSTLWNHTPDCNTTPTYIFGVGAEMKGVVFADFGAFRPLTWSGGSVTKVGRHAQRVWGTAGLTTRGGGFTDEGDSSEQELQPEEAFSTNEGDRVVRDGDSGLEPSLPADAWSLSEEGGE